MGAASIRVPSVRWLSDEMRRAIEGVGLALAEGGFRVWLVGGAVRDLALGQEPGDIDLASAATPEQVEAIIERCVPVGRAFGTLIVPIGALEIQHTTFRTESSYSDGRRPDRVAYGTSLEEDARRRDFTCNSLYLDPLRDELCDPVGGFEDLRRGRLRCVGLPGDRFAEDGLRLMRLARFSGAYDLEVESELLEAARRSAPSIESISAERVLHEFERIFERPGAARAMQLLAEIDVLARVLGRRSQGLVERFARLVQAPGATLGWALLLWPGGLSSAPFGGSTGTAIPGEGPWAEALDQLDALRASRDLRRNVSAVWRCARGTLALLGDPRSSRAAWIRLARDPAWGRTLQCLRGLRAAEGLGCADLDDLEQRATALSSADLHPTPLVDSRALREAGIQPGPHWGQLLQLAEDAQLNGELAQGDDLTLWLQRTQRGLEPADD